MTNTHIKYVYPFTLGGLSPGLSPGLSSAQFIHSACLTLWKDMDCSTSGFSVHQQLSELAQWTHVHWVSDAIPPSHPLSSPSHPTLNLSQNQGLFQSQLFSSSGQSIGGFIFSISPFNEYSGLSSFRIDYFDLFEVQGTLKSLLQHHSSKASILQCSAFLMIQLTSIHGYWKKKKKTALTRRTFVSKVIALLFNMLSRLVIAFLPRNTCLLISWLQSPSAVVLEPPPLKK